MSILQIEISDETRQKIEERAQREGRDAGSWLVEVAENALNASQEQEEAERRYVETELLKALDSPMVEVTPQWWERFTKETMARVDAEHSK